MAFRVLRVTNVREILRRWLKGKSERKIAAGLADRKTIRRYVAVARGLGLDAGDDEAALTDELVAAVSGAVRPGAPQDRGDTWALCLAHRELLAVWRAEGAPGPKLRKLLLRHTGETVALRTLQRFVAEELGGASKPGPTVHVADCPPGQELQVDFEELGWVDDAESGKRRKLHAFVCVANYSRHMFLYPCWHQTQATVIEALEAAWQFFGGIFAVVIPDNLRAVVLDPDAVHPQLTEGFLDYAQARDFDVGPARVRKPQDKGRVENGVKFTQGDFFSGERHTTLAAWREWAVMWCRTDAGLRDHGTTHQQPLTVFERDERPVLKAAPTTAWDLATWQDAKVGRDHRIRVLNAFYQLPSGYVGETLRVRVDRTTIRVSFKGVPLRTMVRVERGCSGGNPEDIPEHQRDLAQRDGSALAAQAHKHGPHIGAVAERLVAQVPFFNQARKVHRLLKLCTQFGDHATDLACKRALDLDIDDVMRIERALERGVEAKPVAVTPTPVMRLPKPRFARDPETFRMRAPPRGADHAAIVPKPAC